jgi:hypothetical protein
MNGGSVTATEIANISTGTSSQTRRLDLLEIPPVLGCFNVPALELTPAL